MAISSVAVHRRHGRHPNEARDIKATSLSPPSVKLPSDLNLLTVKPSPLQSMPTYYFALLPNFISQQGGTRMPSIAAANPEKVSALNQHPMVNCHRLSMALLSVRRWKCRRSSASQARPCSLGTKYPNNHKTPHRRFGKSCYLLKSINRIDWSGRGYISPRVAVSSGTTLGTLL